ncbi:YfcC family protein [Algoriphagus kandeliae]|uniref:YfcC family protein n=1 Tax=Algoriphagus kandeliae TaxID=2562278 RepID=A0A4Y9QPW9_9BACT|nr:YfcC family protein [Algoriphagus kandeliae]TFV94227.1 YfcC family protein [Algoriphagus kandeliae]
MKKITFPHPLIILVGFVLLSWVFTFLIPSGNYERKPDELTGREVVVKGSYELIEKPSVSFQEMLMAIPEGIILGGDIVVLILLIGGAFYVVEKTGALQAGVEALIFRFQKQQNLLLIFLSLGFSFAGATIAMQEEIIAMAPILIILAKNLRMDIRSIIGLTLGSSLAGAAFSPINPFNSLLGQQLAELDLSEGLIFRMIVFIIGIGLWTFLMIRNGKSKEPVTASIKFEPSPIGWRHSLILFLSLGGIIVMGWGITQHDWGYNEMSSLFFVIGISCGLIGKLGLNGTAKTYSEGFGEMIFAGVIVGLARSVYLVLEKGKIIDTVIYSLFTPLEGLPDLVAVNGLFLAQCLIHIPVPSTSGQNVLTIPLAVPLMDLLGISRQLAVLATQYAVSMMDMITPTNGGMMAVVAAAGVKFNDWIRFIIKSWLAVVGICLLSLIIALIWFH